MFDAAVAASKLSAKESEANIQHNRELAMRSLTGEWIDPKALKPARPEGAPCHKG